MGKVFASFTLSLDGYVAGPNISHENPMGEDGDSCTTGCSTRHPTWTGKWQMT